MRIGRSNTTTISFEGSKTEPLWRGQDAIVTTIEFSVFTDNDENSEDSPFFDYNLRGYPLTKKGEVDKRMNYASHVLYQIEGIEMVELFLSLLNEHCPEQEALIAHYEQDLRRLKEREAALIKSMLE